MICKIQSCGVCDIFNVFLKSKERTDEEEELMPLFLQLVSEVTEEVEKTEAADEN